MGRNQLKTGRKGEDAKGAGPVLMGSRLRLQHGYGSFSLRGVKLGSQPWLPSTVSAGISHPGSIQWVMAMGFLSARKRQSTGDKTTIFFFKGPNHRVPSPTTATHLGLQ